PVARPNDSPTPHDIAERDWHEIVDDSAYRNDGRVKTCRNLPSLGEQPGHRQKIHIGNTMLKARRHASRDRQYTDDDLIRDRTTRIREPNAQAYEYVAQDAFKEQRHHVGTDLCHRRIQDRQPDAAAVHIKVM